MDVKKIPGFCEQSYDSIANVRRIVTHGGGAHMDDFLGVSLLLAILPTDWSGIEIVRGDPSKEDISSNEVLVLDVGGDYDPGRLIFDHHQRAREEVPRCATGLLLRYLGIWESCRRAWPWLEALEYMDVRGPAKWADRNGIDFDIVESLQNPFVGLMLRDFSESQFDKRIMAYWGHSLVCGVASLFELIKDVIEFPRIRVKGVEFIDARQHERFDAGKYKKALNRICKEYNLGGTVYRINSGICLYRHGRNTKVDFVRVKDNPWVTFVHPAGFIAKTESGVSDAIVKDILSASIT